MGRPCASTNYSVNINNIYLNINLISMKHLRSSHYEYSFYKWSLQNNTYSNADKINNNLRSLRQIPKAIYNQFDDEIEHPTKIFAKSMHVLYSVTCKCHRVVRSAPCNDQSYLLAASKARDTRGLFHGQCRTIFRILKYNTYVLRRACKNTKL